MSYKTQELIRDYNKRIAELETEIDRLQKMLTTKNLVGKLVTENADLESQLTAYR